MEFDCLFIGDHFTTADEVIVYVKVIPYKDDEGKVNAIALDWTHVTYIPLGEIVTKVEKQ